MPSKRELPVPWSDFLHAVDQRLSVPVERHCSGGFVLAVVYGVPRSTGDLDYLEAAPLQTYEELERLSGRDSKLAKKYKLYLQRAGGVTDLPDGYEERLIGLDLGFSKLSLKILEPYDLLLSKLTRNSPKDREDIKYLAGKLNLNFSTLRERYSKEMKPWLPNADRHELSLNVVWKEYFAE